MSADPCDGPLAGPELVIGLVAAIGTPIERAVTLVEDVMKEHGYTAKTLRLSGYTDYFNLQSAPAGGGSEPERVKNAISRGSEVRRTTGRNEILALTAMAEIRRAPVRGNGKAHILRQLKHPEEVHLLRRVYNDRFLAIGFYMPRSERINHLVGNGYRREEAEEMIETDYYEGLKSGQRFRDTFHLSDVFIRIKSEEGDECKSELNRFFSLLMGTSIITPRIEEFGMFQAYGAALRSSQMGRQVGASILSDIGDIISVGTNEVPQAFGGGYWGEGRQGRPDGRDHKIGYDSNDRVKREITKDIVEKLQDENLLPEFDHNPEEERKAYEILEESMLGSLIEFGRAVHAESDALAAAARMGKSTRYADLFCTTFPCHLCAKQIISSGIKSVTFIEPYPKSRAEELHEDAVVIEEDDPEKVCFKPFVGVAPRRYEQLFSMVDQEGKIIERKDGDGYTEKNLFHPRIQKLEEDVIYRREQEEVDDLSNIST